MEQTTKPKLIEDKTDQELLDRVTKLEKDVKGTQVVLIVVVAFTFLMELLTIYNFY
jgi:hypothetical protein